MLLLLTDILMTPSKFNSSTQGNDIGRSDTIQNRGNDMVSYRRIPPWVTSLGLGETYTVHPSMNPTNINTNVTRVNTEKLLQYVCLYGRKKNTF